MDTLSSWNYRWLVYYYFHLQPTGTNLWFSISKCRIKNSTRLQHYHCLTITLNCLYLCNWFRSKNKQWCHKSIMRSITGLRYTYLRASELTLPSAWTAASLTSTVSQRRSGTTSLYSPVGDTFPAGDLLSLRSVVRLSGDELKDNHAMSLHKISNTSTFNWYTYVIRSSLLSDT